MSAWYGRAPVGVCECVLMFAKRSIGVVRIEANIIDVDGILTSFETRSSAGRF